MKKFLVLALALLMSSNIFAGMVIDNCDDGNAETLTGGWWYTYDDSKTGGNSKVFPSAKSGKFKMDGEDCKGKKGYSALLKGETGNKLGWDFVGMGFTLSKDSSCPDNKPTDISKYKKLVFKIKGRAAGGRLTVVIPYTANKPCGKDFKTESLTDWADYEAVITADVTEEWKTLELDLKRDFKQPKWGKKKVNIKDVLKNAKSISFHFSSADGAPVWIMVDDVELK